MMPRIFIEVGVRSDPECGYGQKFPFQSNDEGRDAYLFFGLPQPVARGKSLATVVAASVSFLLGRSSRGEGLDRLAETARTSLSEKEEVVCPKIAAIQNYAADRGIQSGAFYANGRSLPLRKGSVDGVLFSNVMCDPLLPDEDKTDLIREGLRVVKPGGLVVAREVSCPFVADEYFKGHDWTVTKIDEISLYWPEVRDMYDLPGRGLIFEIERPAA